MMEPKKYLFIPDAMLKALQKSGNTGEVHSYLEKNKSIAKGSTLKVVNTTANQVEVNILHGGQSCTSFIRKINA